MKKIKTASVAVSLNLILLCAKLTAYFYTQHNLDAPISKRLHVISNHYILYQQLLNFALPQCCGMKPRSLLVSVARYLCV